ncbi:uncharacterized protein AB675_5732 [Cyphellophora attinorum]|uniref:Uncharacterized protein n=1 Tax=Cyphellophora attinorum TaxID=1664694 RepID=A0A0N0NL82_9EURO|nr:uncharacterized protein AB675_5732 [Phialophora attinorum]KPI38878.1 hypothetical protein AB675_5732 [Phialophora attinorum]
MAKASLAGLPTELRLQILAAATPQLHTTPATESPSMPLHGYNPLLLVSRQIRQEALTLEQPTAVTTVHVSDLDREIGRRRVEERDWFRKLLVRGIANEDRAKDVEAKLRECWTLVERVELPYDGDGKTTLELEGVGFQATEIAACFNLRGACTCWSYYPWYMQAGAHMMEWEQLNRRATGCRLQ